MKPAIKRAAIIAIGLIAGAQVIRPARLNSPIEANRTLRAVLNGQGPGLRVIDRSCGDCHSNETVWPRYSNVAPASWLIVHDVNEGRNAVNFSEWGSYRAEQRRKMLKESCEEVREGEMPLVTYTVLHPTAKLTAEDVQAVCDLTHIELARAGMK